MAGAVEALTGDLLEWLLARERTYAEVLEAWRTSCPRLPVWEDACDRSLVAREDTGADFGGREVARVTAAGLALLRALGRTAAEARR